MEFSLCRGVRVEEASLCRATIPGVPRWAALELGHMVPVCGGGGDAPAPPTAKDVVQLRGVGVSSREGGTPVMSHSCTF